MSYSDKIARWSVLGIQGALANLILDPYIYVIVLGEVDDLMRDQVLMDCDRAFYARFGDSQDAQSCPSGSLLQSPDRTDCNRIDVAVNLRRKRVS